MEGANSPPHIHFLERNGTHQILSAAFIEFDLISQEFYMRTHIHSEDIFILLK